VILHVGLANDDDYSRKRKAEIVGMYELARDTKHVLTEDPEAAEMIVLAGDFEWLAELRRNDLLRRFPEKTMIYTESDPGMAFLPGLYGSGAKWQLLGLQRTRSFAYFSRFHSKNNPHIRHRPGETKDRLFCFRGKRDCRVRARILDHAYGRSDVEILDTTFYSHGVKNDLDVDKVQREYADALARSHFALCPRGAGFGSIRLFEAMEIGVAPVVMADLFALPHGPDWESFLIQIPESEYARLPELLEPHIAESAERGRLAREAWERYFAPEVLFDRMVEELVAIRSQRKISERMYRLLWPVHALKQRGRERVTGAAKKMIATVRRMKGDKSKPKGWIPTDDA
jgi:hypothetical protein